MPCAKDAEGLATPFMGPLLGLLRPHGRASRQGQMGLIRVLVVVYLIRQLPNL